LAQLAFEIPTHIASLNWIVKHFENHNLMIQTHWISEVTEYPSHKQHPLIILTADSRQSMLEITCQGSQKLMYQLVDDRAASCPCGQSNIRTRLYILTECPKFTKGQVTLPSPCIGDFINFLTSNPAAFAFLTPRELPGTSTTTPHAPRTPFLAQNEPALTSRVCPRSPSLSFFPCRIVA